MGPGTKDKHSRSLLSTQREGNDNAEITGLAFHGVRACPPNVPSFPSSCFAARALACIRIYDRRHYAPPEKAHVLIAAVSSGANIFR